MNKSQRKSIAERVQSILFRIEDTILASLLMLMIGLVVLQIFLRNLFDSGLVWSDSLVRTLVLWVGLVGAMVASRQGNHITIDILDRYLPAQTKRPVNFIVELFTASICTIAAYYSLLFVKMEFIDGGRAFAQIPTWLCEAIIPFAFTVIALRYFMLSFVNLKKMIQSKS